MSNVKAAGPSAPHGRSDAPIRDFSKKTMLEKLLTPNLQPKFEECPELVDYMTWIRAVFALFYGLWIHFGTAFSAAASARSVGATHLIFAFNTVCFIPLAYTITYLRVDQESYGAKLLFAGVPQGMALVMLIWIYLYTVSHEADEMAFATAIGSVSSADDSDGTEGSSSSPPTDPVQSTTPMEESEF